MTRFRLLHIVRLSVSLVLVAAFACAQSAELGEPVVRSYAGQPLVADIELTALAEPGQAVVVRLANADVYKVANIAVHSVLSSLNMSVMRRDGRQFLHITSTRPVNAEYLHLFLDLAEGSKRSVRAATLWLSPDPSPAPPPAPAPALVAAVVAKPAPVIAPVALPAPARAEPAPPSKLAARVLRVAPAPAACPAPMSAEKVQSCAETDYKNGLLSAQIVELEEKVKALQVAMEQGGARAVSTLAPPVLTPAVAPPPLALLKKPVAEPASGFPWLLVTGLVMLLAATGGGVFFWLRRRKSRPADTDVTESVAWYSRMAGRLRRKAPVAPPAVPEPPPAA